MSKRLMLERVMPDGRRKMLWLVTRWSDMPDLNDVQSGFVFAFHGGKLIIVRVDGNRYSLPGGRREARKDKSIKKIMRREFKEEARGTLRAIQPLAYTRVERKDGSHYFLAFAIAEVCSLDDFVASRESDARFEVEAHEDNFLLQKLWGGNPAISWSEEVNLLLFREALQRRAVRQKRRQRSQRRKAA